jgi:hypothetical protein
VKERTLGAASLSGLTGSCGWSQAFVPLFSYVTEICFRKILRIEEKGGESRVGMDSRLWLTY